MLSLPWRDYLLVSEAERELGLAPEEFCVSRPLFTCSSVTRYVVIFSVLLVLSTMMACVPSLYTATYLLGTDDTPWIVIKSNPLYMAKVKLFHLKCIDVVVDAVILFL